MKTVHMIGNAHMDPVWLWHRSEGVDAVLATAGSACDRLDEFPQFIFTCSGSWFHGVIERHDAALFERVRRFVQQGRWALVGGMVVQPDCNLPSAEAFARQLEVGQEYYHSRFGRTTAVGYNVDSFGHTAYLPRFLRQAGIDGYVCMRPGPWEKPLPANLFRWRSPDGQEVLAFRISGGYGTGADDLREHVQRALEGAGETVEHTMCFYGVGDHGGGPTKRQIEWILANADRVPAARLVMSHPRAFFDAVAGKAGALPVVAGELQHHAIGCYSVERRIKVAMRRAEARLIQAEQTAGMLAGAAGEESARSVLASAWETLLFNQFHDILGGTSLDGASRLAAGEMTAAEAKAGDLITQLTRRAFRDRAVSGEHRIVVLNPSSDPFDGYVEHRPWLQWSKGDGLALVDETGRALAFQFVRPEAKVDSLTGVLFRVAVPARSFRLLRIQRTAGPLPAGRADLRAHAGGIEGPRVRVVDEGGEIRLGDWRLRLDVYEDPSDTWSHSCVNRFGDTQLGSVEWLAPWEPVETGPVRAMVRRPGRFDHSRIWCRLSATSDEPAVRIQLSVTWAQVRQRLVLDVSGPGRIDRRVDLVSGGPLQRPTDGLEYPLGGGMLVASGASTLGVAAPEVFSASVTAENARLTLLRSPFAAHHDPTPAELWPDYPVTDQGRHDFEIVLAPNGPWDAAALARTARDMLAGPILWDLTG